MLHKILLGLFACLSLSTHAADIEEISQTTLLNIDPEQHIIVDVRTKEEFAEGHVPGAINIPLSTIQTGTDQLNLGKDKTVVLYCRSGYRAGKAADLLLNGGYSKLLHLEGDMLGWNKSGLDVEK
ncbi:rhodanese-like domain-containing protein [Paraglaciecola sp. L3A3]|uniref:rhodanese-like domain-containing protein n=1 Tax=Paraglaciecola sp. L3A3 TaxID=2686358 RepID=UPI00131B244A|nr:rhodanese-like domain-containing protein [Paraglaciecola sp. L3A3]